MYLRDRCVCCTYAHARCTGAFSHFLRPVQRVGARSDQDGMHRRYHQKAAEIGAKEQYSEVNEGVVERRVMICIWLVLRWDGRLCSVVFCCPLISVVLFTLLIARKLTPTTFNHTPHRRPAQPVFRAQHS